jgi:hypothetical protein
MTTRPLRPGRRVAALGVAVGLVLAGGVAVAGTGTAQRDASDWYDGDNATVADPHRSDVPLALYDASGNAVTSGSTTAPLAAFAAAGGSVRGGDEFASLFVHLPQKGAAPGAWPGVQATGTDRFTGSGAVTAPAALSGRPLVRTQDGYTLADVVAALPNPEAASPSFVGVYELRLRTSSRIEGVADDYAATWVKVTGTTWTTTTAPVLGGEEVPDPVATAVVPTWPARLTYGTAATVAVRVDSDTGTATGTVRLVSGTTQLATATLSPTGNATLAIARTALAPGARTLQVVYSGAAGAFEPSSSPTKAYTVAKAATGRPTVAITKKPTARKGGSAKVSVPTPTGLPKATGKVTVTLKKAAATKRVTGTLKSGVATVTLPKLPKGTWTVTATYPGDARYLGSASSAVRLVVKAR